MNRAELVDKLAERTGEYKYVMEEFVKQYESIITEALLDGEDVHLHGFVTFCVKQHNKKIYFNPKTGESRQIAPSNKIKVRVSDTLNNQL